MEMLIHHLCLEVHPGLCMWSMLYHREQREEEEGCPREPSEPGGEEVWAGRQAVGDGRCGHQRRREEGTTV